MLTKQEIIEQELHNAEMAMMHIEDVCDKFNLQSAKRIDITNEIAKQLKALNEQLREDLRIRYYDEYFKDGKAEESFRSHIESLREY